MFRFGVSILPEMVERQRQTLCPDAGQEIIDKPIVGYGVYKYIQKELIRQYLW